MRSFLVLLSLLVLASPALARNENAPPPRIYTTDRLNGEKPVVDGRIDDPVWRQVEWSGGFIQRDPEEGAPPTAPTEFKVLYDAEALYFGFRLHDDPALVRNMLARRDWFPGDWIEVNIDSYHDQRTAFSFTLSLSGTRGDEFISNDGNRWDSSWDPVWSGAAEVDEGGWTAEMKIPLSQLRFDGGEEQVWGLQVHRRIFREEERSTWQPIPKDVSGWVSNFGEIHGLRGLKPARRIEIMPYTVARAETPPLSLFMNLAPPCKDDVCEAGFTVTVIRLDEGEGPEMIRIRPEALVNVECSVPDECQGKLPPLLEVRAL